MFRLGRQFGKRYLMRTPRAFGFQAVDFFWPRPAFGTSQNDHRPLRTLCVVSSTRCRLFRCVARFALNRFDFSDAGVENARHQLVHRFGVVAFHEVRRVAVADEKAFQFVAADARQNCRAGDFVTVQMQNRQNRAIEFWVEKLVGMPARRQRAGFRFAIADDATDQQIGIVEGGAVGMRKRVAQLAAFVNRAGRFGRDMAGNAAGKRELLEQFLDARRVLRNVGIDLGISAFKISVSDKPRPAVSWTGDVNHTQIVRFDDAIEMHINEVQAGRGSPMSQ